MTTRNLHQTLSWLGLILALFVLNGCGGASDATTQTTTITPGPPYSYNQPEQKSDGWQVASAVDLGLDIQEIESLINRIEANDFGFRRVDGVLIVKDNKLILEKHLRTELDESDSWAQNTNLELHAVHSVSKSIMSAAFGIAIEQGLVGGVNDLALDYFEDLKPLANDSSAKQAMTIGNWLTMQHGLDWNEWDVNYLSSANQNLQMIESANPLRFLLDLPSTSQPGTEYAYSTGISYALGQIIAQTSEQRFYDFVIRHIFEPLGINEYDAWYLQGDAHAGSALYLTMRGMAKFGQLYLDGGVWLGQQVVPETWVNNSTQEKVSSDGIRYGYQWWLTDFSVNGEDVFCFYANGWGGQLIFVLPDLNVVVVLTGHGYEDGDAAETSARKMMEDYILPFVSR
jgi:CubicO group peptidase (beta-lactamase class C family)